MVDYNIIKIMNNVKKIIKKIGKQKDFYPWSSELEVGYFLNTLIKMTRAKNILELGTFKGATTICMAEAVKSNGGGKVYSIDIDDYASKNIKKSGLANFIEYIIGDGVKVVQKLNLKFDLAFIDTGHTKKQCLKEFNVLKNRMNDNGILAFHDSISFAGVGKAMQYIKSLDNFEVITLLTPTDIEKKELYGLLPNGITLVRKVAKFNRVKRKLV